MKNDDIPNRDHPRLVSKPGANHPNRNWQRRWTLDVPAATATHTNGMRVRFVTEAAYADMPPAEIGGKCWDANGCAWFVLCLLHGDDLRMWLQAQKTGGDAIRLHKHIARLMREAGELWTKRVCC